jgi:methyl-accepting chemotaxis protein
LLTFSLPGQGVDVKLRGKFNLMVVVAAAGLLTVAGFWIRDQRSTMLSEKLAKTKNLAEVPYSIIERQYQLESEGKISRQEAQRQAVAAIQSMRYEGSNYFWINDDQPKMIMHPMKPELDGKDLTSFKDPSGRAIFVEFVAAAQASQGAYVRYLWPKPGKDQPVAKLSFVKRFAPWGWVIGTGIYIDDVDAAWRGNAIKAGGLALACLLPLLVLSITTSRSIFRRLSELAGHIRDVAEGERDLTRRIAIRSRDEVGELAKWFNVFMDKQHGLVSSIAETAGHVAAASEELSAASQRIAANSEETSAQTNVVTEATQHINQNLQSVSAGAGEMATSIQSIASNAHQAAVIASNAVQAAQAANASVSKLGQSSAEIGAVTKVITSIAEQTNLLALNATIEAARAGEAGKGFAVVANEVKELAKQTAQATEDISRKITAIQTDTKGAVDAIGSIGSVITHVNDISGTIATAVEEQSATTNEMTRNLGDAATGAGEIAHNIEGVAQAAQSTSESVQELQKAASALTDMSGQLRTLVAQFKIDSTPQSAGKRAPGKQFHHAAAGSGK